MSLSTFVGTLLTNGHAIPVIAWPKRAKQNLASPFGAPFASQTYGKELMQHNPPPEIDDIDAIVIKY